MNKTPKITIIAIISLVLIWGMAYPIYKVGLSYTPPILFAGMRTFIGGILLFLVLLPTLRKLKFKKNWKQYIISAILNTVLFFGIQTVGLVFLPGGMFAVLIYFQPVLLSVLAWLWLGEDMTKKKIIGLILGGIGVLLISFDGISGDISTLGIFLALVTAVVWAMGTVYVKSVSTQVDFLWMIAMQTIIGGSVLLLIGNIFEDFSNIVWNNEYIFSLGYGITLGIPIAYILYFGLINAGDSSKVASYTFLVPLISVLIGTLFLEEPLTFSLLTGMLLVVCSIYIVNYTKKKFKNMS